MRLVCADSKVMEHVEKLEKQGVEILACTTCLEYLNLSDKLAVGRPTTMVKLIEAIFQYHIVGTVERVLPINLVVSDA